jgi:hypothetical protein
VQIYYSHVGRLLVAPPQRLESSGASHCLYCGPATLYQLIRELQLFGQNSGSDSLSCLLSQQFSSFSNDPRLSGTFVSELRSRTNSTTLCVQSQSTTPRSFVSSLRCNNFTTSLLSTPQSFRSSPRINNTTTSLLATSQSFRSSPRINSVTTHRSSSRFNNVTTSHLPTSQSKTHQIWAALPAREAFLENLDAAREDAQRATELACHR